MPAYAFSRSPVDFVCIFSALLMAVGGCRLEAQPGMAMPRSAEYAKVQEKLASGWNTWDTHSVMSEVLLPEGLAVRIGIKDQGTEGSEDFLPAALIGRQGKNDERVVPGPHAYDGSYSDLKLLWRGREVRIQSAHDGKDMVMLVTPLASGKGSHLPAEVVFSVGMLWSLRGSVDKREGRIEAEAGGQRTSFFLAGKDAEDLDVPVAGAYYSAELSGPVGLSSGRVRSIAEIQAVLDRELAAYREAISRGPNAGTSDQLAVRDAIETTIGWDTIYEPVGRRVISPVSRIWSVGWGGYVLFDWDTFFAATLSANGDRDLAYANAIEILREATPQGFVPNYARSGGWKSEDRSEPPVGAITVLGLYQKFHDKWLLGETFPALLKWNRWWDEHRQREGYLVWGSDGENEPRNLDDSSVGTLSGAVLESGLDNSPMYDGATYDAKSHQMEFADVGLMGMYVADCDALSSIAEELGEKNEAAELTSRAGRYRVKLATMWDEKAGIFLNKDLRTGQSSHRLSPTNFYPLLAKAATPAQAERMVKEHLLNPQEFWGEYVIPSIARDDPAYKDQDYWRGRIWGPMNYLVFLGLRNYSESQVVSAREQLAAKSLELFMKEWRANGHVHENYNGTTGVGDDVGSSDRFYHWGALLGLMSLEEAAHP